MAVTGAPELLIVMSAHATPAQVDEVVARLEEAGCAALVTPGREATVIGAIGERELLATLPLEGYAGVEQVLPILKPYKLVSRELSPDPTVIQARGRRIGDGYFGFIAGPCTVETREQTLETARAVAAEGVTMLRGGAFKPRTSPYTFQGLGEDALVILREAREETGLEVELVELFHAYSDPARDPRRHTASTVFIGRAAGEPVGGDDAARAVVAPADAPPGPLVFDHATIVADFLAYRRTGRRPPPRR